ncbi:Isoleucine--tRNA ligase [Rhizoctonia solani]|uniref:Isoleucine--tRNA ligase n=1 Tax=Rhizoctonia solani TaxID=456999 RepID=A0A0K6FP23_9AGAM|nr:Isoleucine--tRNA ligase [Rhizoctonia solani]
MPLYLLVRPSPKRGEKAKTGLHGYMHKYRKRAPICYPADAPQESDEEGKELDPDAQVWKTYVREADQVDEEMVDGWNKSMDVILIFAALFSAISTAFVIESYKNLKPDPADASSQTLLIISQTLMIIANGSQPSSASPTSVAETTGFEASAKDICVNVLWFLSLSLSVAVSLISMLAKEWCLEFMSGRTGPPGPQACRRQQRWDGLVKWKMKEVILMLPSLIHVSLLLFAIGLCVFLWDVHYGVAIPVVIVTTVAAGAYFACTIVPLLYQFCPYGTVLSRAIRQFKNRHSRITQADWMNRDVVSNALHWMITNCETPRSVDIALQSLATADYKEVSREKLEEVNAWAMIKQRFESTSLIRIIYSDSSALKGHARCWRHGMLYLLTNPNRYNLTNYVSGAIALILRVTIREGNLHLEADIEYHTQYINNIRRNLVDVITFKFASQFLTALHTFWSISSLDQYHRLTSEMYILVVKALCLADYNDMDARDRWNSYEILRNSPLPVCSPQLIQELSSSGLIRYLSDLASNDDANRRIFATAQLWLWFNMSLSELDRTNPALTTLEKALLQYPGLENKLENQEQVAEGLETKLMELLDELHDETDQHGFILESSLRGYACRVIEIMFQKRSSPLPRNVSDGLEDIPEDFRGIESFKNLDTDALVTDPDIVFVQIV